MTLMDEFREELTRDPELAAHYQRALHETEEGLRPCDCEGHTSPLMEIAGAALMLLCLPVLLPLLYLDARRQARALRASGRDL